jgi:hypothetical protein
VQLIFVALVLSARAQVEVTPLCDEVMLAVKHGATAAQTAKMVREAPKFWKKDLRCLRALVAPEAAVSAAKTRYEEVQAGRESRVADAHSMELWIVILKPGEVAAMKVAHAVFGAAGIRVDVSHGRQRVSATKGAVWQGGTRKSARVSTGTYRVVKIRALQPVGAAKAEQLEASVFRKLKQSGAKIVVLKP